MCFVGIASTYVHAAHACIQKIRPPLPQHPYLPRSATQFARAAVGVAARSTPLTVPRPAYVEMKPPRRARHMPKTGRRRANDRANLSFVYMGTWCAGLPRVDTSPAPVTPAAALPVPRTGEGGERDRQKCGQALGWTGRRLEAPRAGGGREARGEARAGRVAKADAGARDVRGWVRCRRCTVYGPRGAAVAVGCECWLWRACGRVWPCPRALNLLFGSSGGY